MQGLDISNFTTHFTVDQVKQWKNQGVGLALIQLISGVRLSGNTCATQILTCLEGGLAVDCYLFSGNDGLSLTTQQRLNLVPAEARVKIRQLWIDIEPASTLPSKSAIDKSHTVCDAWAPWSKCGDYTAKYVAAQMGWLPWPWPNRKQWLVNVYNDGHANLGGDFSGTNNHVITQYHEDVSLAGVSGMDRNLLSQSEELEVIKWLGGPMAITVGTGMAAQMVAAGDTPLCDHVNYQQNDDDGNVYDVERCQGSKGIYVSSNSSGNWVNVGPLAQ